MLTDEQRAELEALGPETVRIKLLQAGAGRGAALSGFKFGGAFGITRRDVEDWLAEKHAEEAVERKSTLQWAKIAGWAAIVSIAVTVVLVSPRLPSLFGSRISGFGGADGRLEKSCPMGSARTSRRKASRAGVS
jgi:hypothetical protein